MQQRPRGRVWATWAWAFCGLPVIPLAWSADPQPYRVQLGDTQDSALNEMLQSTSELVTLRKSAPVGPLGLIGRARGDLDRFKTINESD